MAFMKQLPRDKGDSVCAAGSENKTFFATIGAGTATTTGWDAVTLPEGVECKQCIIQVLTGTVADDVAADPIPFAFSSESDGSAYNIVSSLMAPGVGKSSGILGYVYTGTADLKIAVTVLS